MSRPRSTGGPGTGAHATEVVAEPDAGTTVDTGVPLEAAEPGPVASEGAAGTAGGVVESGAVATEAAAGTGAGPGTEAAAGPDAGASIDAGPATEGAAVGVTAPGADSAGAGAEAAAGPDAGAATATDTAATTGGGAPAADAADAGDEAGERSEFDRVPPRARWFVGVLLVLLAVPGIIGFELWPLTGWRLFSLSRDASQTKWVVHAVAEDGSSRPVSLEELPLRYRHAEWPMAELPGASDDRRQAVCEALLGAVVDVVPGTAAVEITRDRQELVKRDGEWTLTHDPEVVHTCAVPGAEPAGGEGRP